MLAAYDADAEKREQDLRSRVLFEIAAAVWHLTHDDPRADSATSRHTGLPPAADPRGREFGRQRSSSSSGSSDFAEPRWRVRDGARLR